MRDDMVSNMIVSFLRLAVSAEIAARCDFFAPFIMARGRQPDPAAGPIPNMVFSILCLAVCVSWASHTACLPSQCPHHVNAERSALEHGLQGSMFFPTQLSGLASS